MPRSRVTRRYTTPRGVVTCSRLERGPAVHGSVYELAVNGRKVALMTRVGNGMYRTRLLAAGVPSEYQNVIFRGSIDEAAVEVAHSAAAWFEATDLILEQDRRRT